MKIGDTVQTLGDFWLKPINGMRYREFQVGEVGKVVNITGSGSQAKYAKVILNGQYKTLRLTSLQRVEN
jgi:hypothetical protein